MGNWWIDETPYPGPPELSREEEWELIKFRVLTYFKPLQQGVEAAREKILELGKFLYQEEPPPKKPLTLPEKKLAALEMRKNLNKGPHPKFDFTRNGTRLY